MKITKEILEDYRAFKLNTKNQQMQENPGGQISFLPCPFCETEGSVYYENGFLMCRSCNHWWSVKKPRILDDFKYKIKLYFSIGIIAGMILMFLVAYFIGN